MRFRNVSYARGRAQSVLWLQDGLLRLVNERSFSVPCNLMRIIQSTIHINAQAYHANLD